MKKPLLFFIFLYKIAFSQEIYDISEKLDPNPPERGYFYNYSEKGNVDLATGKFGLNVPFHQIESEYINLPIGIQYQTSGVKVSEISSTIGTGWSFYGEGKIIRELKGEPDEVFNALQPAPCGGCTPYSYGNLYSGRKYPSYPILNLKQLNSFTTKPTRGSITSLFLDDMMYKFPNLDYFNGVGNPWEVTDSEIEAVLLTKNRGVNDTQRDIFHVSVGDLKFSFAFRIKPEFANHSNHNTPDLNIQKNMFEAIPLDDKAIKIEYFITEVDYYKLWDNLDENDIRINRTRNSKEHAITKFVITDKKGVKYTFNKYEFIENEQISTIVSTSLSVSPSRKYIQFSLENIHIGVWKISKINMPNGHEIEYLYEKNISETKHEVPRLHVGEYKNKIKNLSPTGFDNGLKYIYNGVDGWKLKSIDYFNTKARVFRIKFDHYLHRNDYETGGENLKKISLVRFVGAQEYEIKNLEFIKFFAEIDDGSTGHRMFLSEIIDSEKKHSFLFEYDNPEGLPTTTAYWSSDIYGYYKGGRFDGNSDDVYFPEVYVKTSSSTEGNRISYFKPKNQSYVLLQGTDKSPNSSFSSYGTLKKVTFPTKGYLEIDYEPNMFYDSNLDIENQIGPGVRVKNLNYFSDQDKISHRKTYEYEQFTDQSKSSGNLLYKPSYSYIVNEAIDNDVSNIHVDNAHQIVTYRELQRDGVSHNEILKKLTRLSTHPLSSNSDINGAELIYSNVREKVTSSDFSGNLGYTEYTFHYNDDSKTEVNSSSGPTTETTYTQSANRHTGFMPYTYPWQFGGTGTSQGKMVLYGEVEKKGYGIYPFPDISYYGDSPYLNGKLMKVEEFDNLQRKKSSEIYTYEKSFSQSLIDIIGSFNIGYSPTHIYAKGDIQENHWVFRDTELDGIHFFAKEKIYFNSPINMKTSRKILYLEGEVVSETSYEFNDDNLLSKKEYVVNSNEKIYTNFFYTKDNLPSQSQAILDELITSNRISELLETKEVKEINGTVVPLSKTVKKVKKVLKDEIEYILPEKISSAKGLGELKNEVMYHEYNDHGNPLELSKSDGTHVVYIWGYQNTQPVAKIEGVRFSDIPTGLYDAVVAASNADNDRTIGSLGKEGELRTALQNLRDDLPSAMVTSYTYDPLIGVTSITDPRGATVYYEYDDFNRLVRVKDQDGNVVTEHAYNYKNNN